MLCSSLVVPLLLLLVPPPSLMSSLHHPLPTLAGEMRLVFLLACKELYHCSIQWVKGNLLALVGIISKRKMANRELEVLGEELMPSLELPDLVLENILGRLSPGGLCNMALVCRSMRDWCTSDHLWERHMREKWGGVVGKMPLPPQEWHHRDSLWDPLGEEGMRRRRWRWMESLHLLWPLSCFFSDVGGGSKMMSKLFPVHSTMFWYLALENGRFCFPAQVYNRENGHVGFMLSCYDAELSYDKRTDTFFARYPPHGRRTVMVEDGVTWDRIRVSPVDTPASELHVSECLNALRPGDHIEIQWRRNKEFPYGWWYGVVGHVMSCDQDELHCLCHSSDAVVIEFNHFAAGSRWRQILISRKNHREEGNETGGFYGGIRKLQGKEISTWKKFWPNEIFQ